MMIKIQHNCGLLRSRKVSNAFHLAIVITMAATLTVMLLMWRSYRSALRVIEAADLSVHDTSGITINAAPKRIAQGQSLTRDELVSHLQAAGYVGGTSQREPGAYLVERDALHVTPRQSWHKPVTVRFAGNRIASLLRLEPDTLTAISIGEVWLEPEPIGAYITTITPTKQKEDFVRRRVVQWSELEDTALFWAVVAGEDHEFWKQHKGVNLKRVVAATAGNLMGGKRSGASTLTMELVRNAVTLNRQRLLDRKIQEFYLAAAMESLHSKEHIFTMWANHAPFGSYGIVQLLGVGAASEALFGKSVRELDDAEAATLAAMLPMPNTYLEQVKAGKPDKLLAERNRILNKMRQLWSERFLADAIAAAKQTPIKFLPQSVYEAKPIDVLMRPLIDSYLKKELETYKVKQQLKSAEASRLVVETNFDADLMRETYRIISQKLPKLEIKFPPPGNRPGNRMLATIAVIDTQGHIVSLMGGAGGKDSAQYANQAIFNRLQPASIIKALWLASAIEQGIRLPNGESLTPTTMTAFLEEKANRLETHRFRYWLARSNDECADWLFRQIRLDACALYNQLTGASMQTPTPKMAIGLTDGLELTALRAASAYSVFANRGLLTEPTAIGRIYLDGKEQPLDRPVSQRVFSEETAFLVSQTLRAVVGHGVDGAYGTAANALRDAGLPKDAALFGKTGSGPAGTFFISASPKCAISVQVGYQYSGGVDHRAELTAAKTALPLWVEVVKAMRRLRPDLLAGQFEVPGNLVTKQINLADGCLYDGPGSSREYFMKGTEPSCVSPASIARARAKKP